MLPIDDFRYSSETPYPEIKANGKNPAYGRVMLDNLGGANSEMSAISLYLYDNLITGCRKDVAAVFHNVMIVEMRHLDIFGKLACLLGEDPRMWTHCGCKMTYWSPGYNQYPGDFSALMLYAIDSEKAAISKYEHQISYIRDENITESLRRVIMDERLHVEIFERIYAAYCR